MTSKDLDGFGGEWPLMNIQLYELMRNIDKQNIEGFGHL